MNKTSTDYYQKQSDIYIYSKDIAGIDNTVGFGSHPAKMISGPLKAAQTYAKVLLSNRGERKEDPEHGTFLISDFSSGNLTFPIQISQFFSINNLRAITYLNKKYKTTTPLDERIQSARLTNYSVKPKTKIDLNIELKTASRDSLIFLLPVSY